MPTTKRLSLLAQEVTRGVELVTALTESRQRSRSRPRKYPGDVPPADYGEAWLGLTYRETITAAERSAAARRAAE
jgi:hypothetical protein